VLWGRLQQVLCIVSFILILFYFIYYQGLKHAWQVLYLWATPSPPSPFLSLIHSTMPTPCSVPVHLPSDIISASGVPSPRGGRGSELWPKDPSSQVFGYWHGSAVLNRKDCQGKATRLGFPRPRLGYPRDKCWQRPGSPGSWGPVYVQVQLNISQTEPASRGRLSPLGAVTRPGITGGQVCRFCGFSTAQVSKQGKYKSLGGKRLHVVPLQLAFYDPLPPHLPLGALRIHLRFDPSSHLGSKESSVFSVLLLKNPGSALLSSQGCGEESSTESAKLGHRMALALEKAAEPAQSKNPKSEAFSV
jgi:hypothetical protein